MGHPVGKPNLFKSYSRPFGIIGQTKNFHGQADIFDGGEVTHQMVLLKDDPYFFGAQTGALILA